MRKLLSPLFACALLALPTAGAPTGPLKIAGQSGKTIDGGGATWSGQAGKNGLDLVRCKNCTIRNLTLSGWGQGIRITDCQDVTFEAVTVKRCLLQGILVIGSRRLTFKNCQAFDNATRDPNNKGHNFYAGEWDGSRSSDLKLLACTIGAAANPRQAPFQINSESGGAHEGTVVEGGEIKSGPAGAVNCLGAGTKAKPVRFVGVKIIAGGSKPAFNADNWSAGRPSFVRLENCRVSGSLGLRVSQQSVIWLKGTTVGGAVKADQGGKVVRE